MSTAADPQTSLYETTIENPALEKALEERQTKKEQARAVRKKFKEADDQAKALINTLDLGDDAPVRVGRFVITRKPIDGRHVSFDTDPTSRLNIRPLEDAA